MTLRSSGPHRGQEPSPTAAEPLRRACPESLRPSTRRDIGLSRITDVSYRQSVFERLINSGTLTIESAGDSGATVLRHIPDSDGVQQLLNHMIEEDADRRAQENAEYIRGEGDQGQHPTRRF